MRARRIVGLAALNALVLSLLAITAPARADHNEAAHPSRVPAAEAIAAGDTHTCALVQGGAVRCWGFNGEGQLGYGSIDVGGDGATPETLGDVPLGGTALAISAGERHTCALMTTGTIRCWGSGAQGQLGYGSTDSVGDDETPAEAGDVPLGGTAVAVSAGGSHTCAVMSTGAVRCWGARFHGQLGYGSPYAYPIDEVRTPEESGDVPLGGTAVAVSAGVLHTCALLDDGGVRCWGTGANGRLGYGDLNSVGDSPSNLPKDVGDVPLGGPAVAVSAGATHTCAVLETGSVRCWGSGADGRLGYGSTDDVGDDETPEDAGDVHWIYEGFLEDDDDEDTPLVTPPAVSVSAGGNFTCAVSSTSLVVCWGAGGNGQLGYGEINNVGDVEPPGEIKSLEVWVVEEPDSVLAVTTGSRHACAVTQLALLKCWGDGGFGRLGYGNNETIGDDESPSGKEPVPVGREVRLVYPLPPQEDPNVPGTPAEPQPPVAVDVRHKLSVKKKRDRQAPYVYRLSGRITGDFVQQPPACAGQVRITVARNGKTVARKKVQLGASCQYKTRVKIAGRKISEGTKVKLVVRAKHAGNAYLEPSTGKLRVFAR